MRRPGAARRSTSRAPSTPRSSSTCARSRLQRPHPPLFIASTARRGAVRARLGLPTLSSFFVPVAGDCSGGTSSIAKPRFAAGRSLPEIEALEARSWGCGWCTWRPITTRRCAPRGPVHGLPAAHGGAALGRTGARYPDRSDRSLLRLRAFREYLDDGWALIGTPAGVTRGLQQFCEATATSACSW